MTEPFAWQCFILLLSLCMNASCGLVPICLLTLVIARRGHASFCINGLARLLGLALVLSLPGLLAILGDYAQSLAFTRLFNPGKALLLLKPLFSSAGLPWLTGMLAWIFGIIFFFQAWRLRPRLTPPSEKIFLKEQRIFCTLLILAMAFFLATFILRNWPFAGLPQGLSMERASLAVIRHGLHSYFMALGPAGAIALCFCAYLRNNFANTGLAERGAAVRWLAFWAFAGFLPNILQRWGLFFGVSLRHENFFASPGIGASLVSLLFLSLACLCWLALLLRPMSGKTFFAKSWFPLLSYLGLIFLIFSQFSILMLRPGT